MKQPARSRNRPPPPPAPNKQQNKPLDKGDRRFLRSLAHALKPVVRLGQHGLTEAVLKELDGALSHHELVKIKLSVSDKESRTAEVESICRSMKAECVQQIGHTATLFRRNLKKPVIEWSSAKR